MKRLTIALLIAVTLSAGFLCAQQQMKPWAKWSEEEAKKILENSPWAQTQVQSDAMLMFPNAGQFSNVVGRSPLDTTLPPDLALPVSSANMVNYYIRFLSAKPVRQALARITGLNQKNADPTLQKGISDFVENKPDHWIVIAVGYECKNQRFSGPVMGLFNGATLSTLRNDTFLEIDGKRVFLENYQAPSSDGLGAKFLFPRSLNGAPLIAAENREVRFFAKLTSSETSKPLILNMRFKVAEFRYEGVLEF